MSLRGLQKSLPALRFYDTACCQTRFTDVIPLLAQKDALPLRLPSRSEPIKRQASSLSSSAIPLLYTPTLNRSRARSYATLQAKPSGSASLSPIDTNPTFTSHNGQTHHLFKEHGYESQGCLLMKIAWGDQDSYGHVNNVKYVRYFESSRVNYFDILADEFADLPRDFMGPNGIGLVLRKTSIDYLSQLKRNDVIAISHRLASIGNTSFCMEAMIVHEGRQEIVATASEVMVMYDFVKGQKTQIPESWRRAFQSRLQEEEENSMW